MNALISPSIALTVGEPAGIGPDLTVQIAQQHQDYSLIAIADPDLLKDRARHLNLPLELVNAKDILFDASQQNTTKAHSLYVQPHALVEKSIPGQLNTHNSRYVLDTLTHACKGCLSGQYHAMVTAPVNKAIINEAGVQFSGHTEWLATLTNTEHVVMMLACEGLKVALVTTHIPLSQVAQSITHQKLKRTIEITAKNLSTHFGIPNPRLVVCGLNPHAGEGGHMGREEVDIIEPCLATLRAQGFNLKGPLPADTLFTPPILQEADAVVSMYHDQGLPVLKYKGFGRAYNITLGLPIIRTSVDHGTALELAGTGKASTGSLKAALNQAVLMAKASTANLS